MADYDGLQSDAAGGSEGQSSVPIIQNKLPSILNSTDSSGQVRTCSGINCPNKLQCANACKTPKGEL